MRTVFDRQLGELNCQLMQMGAMVERAIAGAAKALLEGDAGKAHEIASLDGDIDQKEREIERLCLLLLLQQQPVAKDFRQISAALKMITDMERIGDQAADISEIALLLMAQPELHILHIDDMARAVIKMVTESIDAFVRQDLELVRAVIAYDDIVDGYFDKIKHELVALIAENRDCGSQVIDYLMIAKYLERIGDHATNIAEWVEFAILGEHRKHPQAK